MPPMGNGAAPPPGYPGCWPPGGGRPTSLASLSAGGSGVGSTYDEAEGDEYSYCCCNVFVYVLCLGLNCFTPT